MKTSYITYLTIISLALLSSANAQGKRSIDARISGWTVHISYSDIYNLPPGTSPVTKVRLSHPTINSKANMEVPFQSFFALWEHLDSTSDTEAEPNRVDLPSGKDGAVLKEEDEFRGEYKIVTSDKAVLLVRFWLDTFKHLWVEDLSNVAGEQSKIRGTFGYILKHSHFSDMVTTLEQLTDKNKGEQAAPSNH